MNLLNKSQKLKRENKMSSMYTNTGDSFTPISKSTTVVTDLESGVYTVVQPSMGPIYLERSETFALPKKRYGGIDDRKSRILNTFRSRDTNTGVLLVGNQGSGKTLLAHEVIDEAVNVDNIICLIIKQAITGPALDELLTHINQPAVVFIDEFEKIYDSDDQERMLSTMNGSHASKKLFILTCNNKYAINRHMLNRPGRIYYKYEYRGLEEGFVREYCEDNLTNKDLIDKVVFVGNLIDDFNFDCLKAIVEESNRYGEDLNTILSHLNIDYKNVSSSVKYVASIIGEDGVDLTDFFNEVSQDTSPLTGIEGQSLRNSKEFNLLWTKSYNEIREQRENSDEEFEDCIEDAMPKFMSDVREFQYTDLYGDDAIVVEAIQSDGTILCRTNIGLKMIFKKKMVTSEIVI